MPRTSDARERLIASALELIYQRSYAEVGVQSLCERAGVKKGNFYYYFDSKQDLLVQALEMRSQELRRMLAPVFDKDVPASSRIETMFKQIYFDQKSYKNKTGQVRGCLFGNLALELSTRDERIRKRVDAIMQALMELVEETLKELIRTGELPEIDTTASAQAVVAFLEGVILFAKLRNDPELILTLAKVAKSITLAHHEQSQSFEDIV
ncbi:MAG: TetR/AcrR family transcriptional regulator [Methylococcaceae bacterium]|nr:TetR/AcrR family transcriptional regulator [Methylococcaceae bacterium]